MHRYRWAAPIAVVVMLLAVGCSEESDTANEQTDGGAGTSAGSGGAGGSSAGSGGSTAGSGGSSAGNGGSSAGTGGSSAGSGGSSTGGTGATGGAGGANPTGGAGGTGNIECGTNRCSGPSQYCCDNYNEPEECLASGATCVYGVIVECDGPEDCAGQTCCATLFIQGQNRSIDSIQCAADCSGNNDRVVCGESDSCPTGQTCGTSELLPPYRDCK